MIKLNKIGEKDNIDRKKKTKLVFLNNYYLLLK